MKEFANLSNTMASESCSHDIDPERTLTMLEDVFYCSDSVDNKQLVSLKEIFDIHFDAPLSMNGLEILVHVCEKADSGSSSKDKHCDRECIHPSAAYFAEEFFTSFSESSTIISSKEGSVIVQATQIENDTVATDDKPEYGRESSFPCVNPESEKTNELSGTALINTTSTSAKKSIGEQDAQKVGDLCDAQYKSLLDETGLESMLHYVRLPKFLVTSQKLIDLKGKICNVTENGNVC